MAALIKEMGKRKNDDDKKARVVWSDHLHEKFVAAVNELGLYKAVPRKIVTLMNVQGITTAHVASHLQKYRLRVKKAAAHNKLPSTLTQSQNTNIHPSYNFPPVHQSHTDQFYSPAGFNMCGFSIPSRLIQSQNINNNSLNIHPPPSTFPIYHQHTSTFPTLVNQSETPLGFATTLDFHDTRSRATNCPFVGSSSKSPSIWDYDWYTKYMKREPHLNNSLPALESDKTSQNSQMSSQQTEPFMDGSASSLEYTNLQLQSTTPFGFAATTFDFHDLGTYVGSTSSKSTSIWDDDWHQKFMKRKPESLQFSHNSLPVLESDKTSQINNSHNVEPFTVGSATSLEDKNINIWCNDDTPIDFSVEETDPNTLEDITNMGRFIEDEDLINAWRWFQEEDVNNVMKQPSCY